MKLTLILAIIISTGFSSTIDSPDEFDYELSDIVRKFRTEIMDEYECEKQKRAADYLADDIEDAIRLKDKYTNDEIIKLKKLKKEAEALEKFIGAVGNCGTYIPSIESFNLANRRVRAHLVNIVKDNNCMDIISVTIGEYVAYLGKNNYDKDYTMSYKWKIISGMNSGNGTMGLPKFCVRHIYDNRETQTQKNITFFEITCQEL